jgi:hypothetical protein
MDNGGGGGQDNKKRGVQMDARCVGTESTLVPVMEGARY